MALSDLESNKFDKVIRWKKNANIDFSLATPLGISQDRIATSEFGDLKVTKMNQAQKRLSRNEITQAATEYQVGMTTYALAEKYGYTRQTISNALKAHGVDITKCKASKKINREEVIAMYADMLTTEQIAQKYSVGPQVITRCLRSNNVKIRTRWNYLKKNE